MIAALNIYCVIGLLVAAFMAWASWGDDRWKGRRLAYSLTAFGFWPICVACIVILVCKQGNKE